MVLEAGKELTCLRLVFFFFKSNTLYIKLESKLIKMPMHSPEIKQSKMTLDTKRPILVQYQWTILIDSGLVPSFFGCLGLISRSRGIHVTTCWRRAPLSIYWLIDAEFYSSCSMIFHQEPGSKTPMKSKEHINQTMQEFDLQAFRSSRQFNPAFWHWGKDSSGPLPWPYGSGRTVFTWAAPPCGPWVFMNSGTHLRSLKNIWGDLSKEYIQKSNTFFGLRFFLGMGWTMCAIEISRFQFHAPPNCNLAACIWGWQRPGPCCCCWESFGAWQPWLNNQVAL